MAPAVPILMANRVSLGEFAVTYLSSLERLLVLHPQGTAVMSAIALADSGTKRAYRGIYLDFNQNLNLPQPVPLNNGYNWKGDPNATLTGQGVPQFPPGEGPPGAAPLPVAAATPPIAAVPYDPATGTYVAPDGQIHTQADLAGPGPKTWQSMLSPAGPP